jgi:hypothetical protein
MVLKNSNPKSNIQSKIILFCAACFVMFSGCQASLERVVKLNADGSGVYVQKVAFSGKFAEMMRDPSALVPDSLRETMSPDSLAKRKEKPKLECEHPSSEKLTSALSKLGEGVRFVRGTYTDAETTLDCTQEFAFSDINKFLLGNDITPSDNDNGNQKSKEPTRFSYRNGLLTIRLPDNRTTPKNTPAKNMTREELPMVESLLGSFKLSMRLETPRPIRSSNAKFKTSNVITLVEMDMPKFFEGKTEAQKIAALNQLGRSSQLSRAQGTALINRMPGFKIEPLPTVTVRF